MSEKPATVQLNLDSLYQINSTIVLHVTDLLNDPLPAEGEKLRFTLFAKTEWEPDQEARQASKAFRAVMADFINFLDKAIFFKRCAMHPLEISPLPKNMTTEELLAFLGEQVDREILAVAHDKKLTNPKKLAAFKDGLDDWAHAAANGYFGLRRCLEHHFQRPDKDIEFLTRAITISVASRELRPGDRVEEGAKVKASPIDRKKVFPANEPVQLKAQDVVDVAVTLIQVINPQIVEYVRRIHNGSQGEQGGTT